MSQAGTTRITGITTVAVPVADQDRALAFYVDQLGFEVRRDASFGPGNRWIEVAPPGSATTVAIPPLGDVRPGVDTGIRLAAPDCEAAHRGLSASGAEVSEILRWPGVPPMFSLKDPDGNTLYVVEG
jgi:catechol 2,3-dioxygenase-like lactoylglutathione lyase family enzyme